MKKPLEYNSINNFDKSSRSVISRSSRLTKKNPEQENQEIVCPYFRKDKVGDRVLERTYTAKSPSKQKQDLHLDRASKIITDLMNRHRKAKEKLQKMKEESQLEHEKQCTFTPTKNPLQRYQVSGNIIRRNQIWLREKKRRELQLKQEVTLTNLKQCTFTPMFQSKKISQSYLRQRNMSRSLSPMGKSQKYLSKNSIRYDFKSPRRQRDFTQAEYQMAKRNLISKMMVVLQ